MTFGKQKRLSRIMKNNKILIMAYSHGVLMGTMDGMRTLEEMKSKVQGVTKAGASGFLLSPGFASEFSQELTGENAPGLVLTVGWTNLWRSDDAIDLTHDKGATHRIACSAEAALRLGADVVHVYLLLGGEDPQAEADEIKRVADFINECDRFGLPVLVETLARGPKINDGNKAEYVLWAARIGAELGADALKVDYPGKEALEELVKSVPVPVTVLGGTPQNDERAILQQATEIAATGAAGIIYGRTIYQYPKSPELVAKLSKILL